MSTDIDEIDRQIMCAYFVGWIPFELTKTATGKGPDREDARKECVEIINARIKRDS